MFTRPDFRTGRLQRDRQDEGEAGPIGIREGDAAQDALRIENIIKSEISFYLNSVR